MRSEARAPIELAAIVALAALLRFAGIGEQNLWIDEVWSLDISRWPLLTLLTVNPGHPPLYHVLEKVMFLATGLEIAGRLVSATIGVASVGLMFAVGRRLFDRRTALLAALLTAVSPLHLWYSREGRMYALVMFFAVAGAWFVKSVAERGDRKSYLAFALTALCGLLTHYAYAGVLAAQCLYLVAVGGTRISRGKSPAVAAAVCVTIAIVVAAILRTVLQSVLGPTRAFGFAPLLYSAFTFVAGFSIGPSVAELRRNDAAAALAPYAMELAGVALVGGVSVLLMIRALRQEGKWNAWAIYCATWLVVPFVTVAAGNLATGVAFNVRYVIGALPAFVLLVAAGLAETRAPLRRIALAGLLLCAGFALWNDRTDPRYAREDLRGAAAYIESHAGPNDRIIISAFYLDAPFGHYLESERRISRIVGRPILDAEQANQVATVQLSPPEGSIWFVVARGWAEDPQGLLARRLSELGHAAVVREFPGVRVYRFDA